MTSPTANQRILESIDRNFPFLKAPEPDEILADISDDLERRETKEFFSNRPWTTLSAEMLRKHAESLFFFTPKTWIYFAPAYMKTMLAHFQESDLIVNMFVATLANHFERYDRLLAPGQRGTILDVLRWLSRRLDRDSRKRRDIKEIVRRFEESQGS